ncbi:MAG: ester cyclase [Candidatus Promineifilaceae bacterium]|nr:ester cyclase [Candidatus Promineifilaceae bacterium]
MSTARNKAVMRRFFQAFEEKDRDALEEVLAPELVAHHPGSPEPLNREALLQTIEAFSAAFSDQEYTIEEQVAEGDKVVTHTVWQATHTGNFQGQPPTGKQVAITGIATDRIEDGKIVEHQVLMDTMGLMQQLGMVPPAG